MNQTVSQKLASLRKAALAPTDPQRQHDNLLLLYTVYHQIIAPPDVRPK